MDTTTSSPIATTWIQVTNPDGVTDAYLATPPSGRGPGLLLLQGERLAVPP